MSLVLECGDQSNDPDTILDRTMLICAARLPSVATWLVTRNEDFRNYTIKSDMLRCRFNRSTQQIRFLATI
jgi:hypothetical protein